MRLAAKRKPHLSGLNANLVWTETPRTKHRLCKYIKRIHNSLIQVRKAWNTLE